MDKSHRNRLLAAGGTGGLLALTFFGACSACGKGSGGATAPSASAAFVNRTEVAPEAGPAAVRDVAMWTSAREGAAEDLASLATHEGAAGLVEAAGEPSLHATALRAMAYAPGWAQLPYLAGAAAGKGDDDARLALASIGELAARPRRSEDVEDVEELGEGCEKLGALARDTAGVRERRVSALGALRMLPCPRQELPTDLDAR
ncbi:MAG: hypothetical protein JWP97_4865 [Labilithrix sp.]|nr:hypothetical protein [Labilithrix sp.]